MRPRSLLLGLVLALMALIAPAGALAKTRASTARKHSTHGQTAKSKPKATKTKTKTVTANAAVPAAATAETLGTFDISTAAQMSTWHSAGGTAVVIPVYWQAAQPNQLGAVSLASAGNNGDNVITEIQQAHAAGLSVYLELSLQYAPNWVLNGVPSYVNQDGQSWSQTSASGENVRDWVWSAAGRQDVASFVQGALADLKPVLSDVAGIRAGGGPDGELGFPAGGTDLLGRQTFWGYDAAAKSGAGLAAGETSSPLPNYTYGTGTAAQDTQWATWYLNSLATWIKWYAQLLRSDGWSGPVYVLHPSFGMRTNMTVRSAAYEQQLSYGTDPATMMNAYDTISGVYPWCTWSDDTEPYWHTGDTVDSDAAAWRKLLELAQARGLAGHIMGENTGGGGSAAIDQLTSGAEASGYKGIFYLDYPYLVQNGLTSYLVSDFDTYAP